MVYLTERVLKSLSEQPRLLHAEFVFVNPATGRPWDAAGLSDVWVHDLRRSFGTLARRSGLPESVVARFSGHPTAAVFKRYNIVEEQDLKAAVALLNRTRKGTEDAQATDSAPGPESVSVDGS